MRIAAALLLLPALATAQDMLAGVKTVGVPGVPGLFSVYGEQAEVVLAVPAGPIVARARLGEGRVVLFSHSFWSVMDKGDGKQLMRNAFAWAGGPTRKVKRIGIRGRRGTEQLRALFGETAVSLDGATWTERLGEVDVLFVGVWGLSAREKDAVDAFVRAGRGLVSGGCGWGWQQIHAKQKLATDNMGNKLLAPAGLVFGQGTIRVPKDRLVKVTPPHPLTHAGRALAALQSRDKLTKADLTVASKTLTRAVADLPPDDTILMARINKLLEQGGVPLPPLKQAQALPRVLLSLQVRRAMALPPDEVKAHAAAAKFPGAVPADAPRVTRTVSVDLAVPGWHSTGLYAAPGEIIKAALAGDRKVPGLRLRIGCHKDTVWHKPNWRRVPQITREFPLADGRAACAFGGLVYVVVPRRGAGEGVVQVRVEGAVPAPRYEHGKTPADEWNKTIRLHPAPWAELATQKVIISVPSASIRGLDDPAALMTFWDKVMDACADLSARPHKRKRPERYVADIQISAGYMHAGYPIMTHLDAAPRFVNLEHLVNKGDWGMFHEMGHNHQHRDWTFGGTGEVTCNLFSLYVLETLCPEAKGHRATSPEAMDNRIKKYKVNGTRFEQWKREPFLALIMYRQLADAFGWDTYKQVFAEYRGLAQAERPKNDAEKRDQWMVRFSRRVGKNLGPFFDWWGVPTSGKARASIRDLPEWMPAK